MDYNNHMAIVEENLKQEEIDNIIRKNQINIPAIIIFTEKKVQKRTIELIKNSLKVKGGTHSLYISIDNKLGKLGDIDLNIDNIFILSNILKRFNTIFKEIRGEGKENELYYENLIHTIKI